MTRAAEDEPRATSWWRRHFGSNRDVTLLCLSIIISCGIIWLFERVGWMS